MPEPSHESGVDDNSLTIDHETEGLPPAAEALHRQLLEDSTLWSRHVAPMLNIEHYVYGLVRERQAARSEVTNATFTPDEVSGQEDQHAATGGEPVFVVEQQRLRRGRWQHERHIHPTDSKEKRSKMPLQIQRNRLRTLGTIMSVAAVVLLLVGVLYTIKSNATRGQHLITPPIQSKQNGQLNWSEAQSLRLSSGAGVPAIAPSNPAIVYEVATHQDASGNWHPVLRRTSDSGATWQTLPLPLSDPTIKYVTPSVSQTNPNIVLLAMGAATAVPSAYLTQHLCPQDPNSGPLANVGNVSSNTVMSSLSAESGISCFGDFISTDGGQHWHLVGPYFEFETGQLADHVAVITQGDSIYGMAGVGSSYPSSICQGAYTCLVVSNDNGLTWHSLTVGIPEQPNGGFVCDARPTATGNTLFALTSAGNVGTCGVNGNYSVWRSDDAGAHWSQVGDTKGSYIAELTGTPTQPVLYTETLLEPIFNGSLNTAAGLWVSSDGGKTWRSAPTVGIAAGQTFFAAYATMSDGGVLAAFTTAASADPTSNGKNTLYVWKVGEASWQRVGAGLPWNHLSYVLVVLSASGSADTLWGVTGPVSSYPLGAPLPDVPSVYKVYSATA